MPKISPMTPLMAFATLSVAIAFVAVMLRLRVRPPRVALAAGLGLAALAAIVAMSAALGYRCTFLLVRENGPVETLCAWCLGLAGLLGAWTFIGRIRRGEGSPLLAFLTCGTLWACARDLEFGADFTGDQFWFSRNLFRLHAYLGPDYFESFRVAVRVPYSAATMYAVHLAFAAVFLGVGAWLLVYILRHRHAMLTQSVAMPRTPAGRYFLVGAGIFLLAQIAGKIAHMALGNPFAPDSREITGFPHQAFEEPLELLGAFCILLSMISERQRNSTRIAPATARAASEP